MFYEIQYFTSAAAAITTGGSTFNGVDIGTPGSGVPIRDGEDGKDLELFYYTGDDPIDKVVVCRAVGGKGGVKGDPSSPTSPALGGSAADCIGDVAYSGGNGALVSNHPITNELTAPYGGGSAGTESDGNAASWFELPTGYVLRPLAVKLGSGFTDDSLSDSLVKIYTFGMGNGISFNAGTTATRGAGRLSIRYKAPNAQFYADGTWLCPPDVTSITVYGIASGGGGGSCDTDSTSGAGGGGGGCYGSSVLSVTPGETYTITIGNAGVGGAAGGQNGADGGSVTIHHGSTLLFKLDGGKGGYGATEGSSGAGGSSGNSSACVADIKYSGGSGNTGGSNYGGGGGSAGGRFSDGFTGEDGIIVGRPGFWTRGQIPYTIGASYNAGGIGSNIVDLYPQSPGGPDGTQPNTLTFGGGGGGTGLGLQVDGADGAKGYITLQW